MKALQVVIAVLLAAVLGVQVYQMSRGPAAGGEDAEKIRKLAIALEETSPRQALAEYERLGRVAALSDEEAANLYYRMGNLAMERLKDYETALTYYRRVEALYPKSSAAQKVGGKIVVCLENTGQSGEAQRALARTTGLSESDRPAEKGSDVLAEVGDARITRRAFELAMEQMAPHSSSPAPRTKEEKLNFLQGLIAKELFYRMAVRKGYDKDEKFLEYMDNVRKTYLGNRIWEEEVTSKVQVTDDEFHSFYMQNREKFRIPAHYARVGLIVCDDEAGARKARERIEAGEDFMVVASEANREAALREAKGILAPFYENQESSTFERNLRLSPLLRETKSGDLVGPVAVRDGSAVIKVFEKEESRIMPFDEARKTRADDYRNALEFDRKQRLMEHLMKTDRVKVYEERL
ncbi:peptidyl-prolyl cis-trans isomerase [bacterium]|nr:peptidyl-prolyl cis-trans isomerase [bacterium]